MDGQQELQAPAAPDGEKREKKELLRSKVQALVASYEDEKRRNEELTQEVERLRTVQTTQPQTYGAQTQNGYGAQQSQNPYASPQSPYGAPPQNPYAAQPQNGYAAQPQPQSGGYTAQQNPYAPSQPPQALYGAQTQQGLSEPSYTLQNFAPQSSTPQQLTPQQIAPSYEQRAHAAAPAGYPNADERYGAYQPQRPAQQQYAPPSHASNYGAYGEQPRYPGAGAATYGASPYVSSYSGGYGTESLMFSMSRVQRRMEQLRARLQQAENLRGTYGYGYNAMDASTLELLDQLSDELGDLTRDLHQLRSSLR